MNQFEEAPKNGSAAPKREFELSGANYRFGRARDEEIDILRIYARTLSLWPRTIAISVILVVAVTGIVSKFFLTKLYKATAIIRPVSESMIEEQIIGLGSGFGSGGGGNISSLLGGIGGGGGGSAADEYVAILNSFSFTRFVIRRHHLIGDLLPSNNPSAAEFESSRHLQWLAYRSLQSRLTVDYSMKTGNITVEFKNDDPARAEMVISYVIDDLRERLRDKQLRDVKAALKSLEAETARTSDIMLQQNLYLIIANQIQREKLAEVESDFAFAILAAPAASDIKVWPPTLLLCLLAALVTFAAVATYILFIHPLTLGAMAPLLGQDNVEETLDGENRRQPVIPDAAQRPVP